ncbi:MAG: hypothetical protein HY517_00955 [Candidatus Aenigmarchaeota archaeon]|nr:hypothetical protein [Candidatus Aenigmarchaeota archaeon]
MPTLEITARHPNQPCPNKDPNLPGNNFETFDGKIGDRLVYVDAGYHIDSCPLPPIILNGVYSFEEIPALKPRPAGYRKAAYGIIRKESERKFLRFVRIYSF